MFLLLLDILTPSVCISAAVVTRCCLWCGVGLSLSETEMAFTVIYTTDGFQGYNILRQTPIESPPTTRVNFSNPFSKR